MSGALPQLQNFQDFLGPAVSAAWLNAVDGAIGNITTTPLSDVFTTTLNQTAFTLTAQPTSASAAVVSLDGSLLAAGDDYTVTATTLTLVNPASANQRLVVRYGVTVNPTAVPAGGVSDASLAVGSRIYQIDQTYIPGAPSNVNYFESLAGVTPTNPGYPMGDARRYGYIADDFTDNSTALANAVLVAAISGNTIDLPGGNGRFSVFPSLAGLQNIVFRGRGSCNSGAEKGTALVYTGTGTGIVVNATGTQGVGFKALQLIHLNAGFTGTYISYGNASNYGFLEDVNMGTSVSNVTHLALDKAQFFRAYRCQFQFGNPSITGMASGSFSVVVMFRDCVWPDGNPGLPVSSTGEAWSFIGCSFGRQAGGGGLAIDTITPNTLFKGLTLLGCWFGDATAAPNWLNLQGLGLSVVGCRFGGFNPGTAITLGGVSGFEVVGSNFDTFGTAINFSTSTNLGGVIQGNNFVSVGAVFGTTANIPPSMVFNPNNVAGALVAPLASVNGKFAVSGYEVSPNGIIRMWGQKTVTAGTPLAITFSTEVGRAFPNTFFKASATLDTPGASATTAYTSSGSTTGVTLNVLGGAATSTVNWDAVGN